MHTFEIARTKDHCFPIDDNLPGLEVHWIALAADKIKFERHAGFCQGHIYMLLSKRIIVKIIRHGRRQSLTIRAGQN